MMKIAIVENETAPREGLQMLVRALGYTEVMAFDSVQAAKQGLEQEEDPLIVLLDHDMGEGQPTGYELCSWLREHHVLGTVLPIVYLTGRIGPDAYLRNTRSAPFDSPTVYLPKAQADEQLPELLERFEAQFERIRDYLLDQSTRRAIAALSRGASADDAEAGEE